MQKVPIPKWDIDLHLTHYGSVHRVITAWQREKFCEQPKVVVLLVVWEFYANAVEHENGQVLAWRCQVHFDCQRINQFYNLSDIGSNDYRQFMVGNIDLDGVLRVLCNKDGMPMSFKAIVMKNDHKL